MHIDCVPTSAASLLVVLLLAAIKIICLVLETIKYAVYSLFSLFFRVLIKKKRMAYMRLPLKKGRDIQTHVYNFVSK